MLFSQQHIKFVLSSIAFVALWTLAACSPESDSDDEPQLPDDGRGWVSVTLHSPSFDSRAESHPDDPAVNHESDVNNITLFFYSAANGLNGPADTQFKEVRYFDSSSFEIEDNSLGRTIKITFKIQNDDIAKNDRIAVVANMGDLSAFNTLGELQACKPAQTWTGSVIADCTNFTMASAYDNDGVIKTANNVGIPGTKANPFSAEMTIERTASRIDLAHDGALFIYDGEEHLMVYPATDKAGKVVGAVYMSHVLPFNVMQQPSYALKRISAAATTDMSCFSSWTYTGSLSKDVNGKPVQYVVEPHTTDKASAAANAQEWFGNTRAALIAEQGKEYFSDKPRFVYDPSNSYTILGYANENTAHTNNTTADALTGIIIRAQYVPVSLHTDIDLANPQTNVPRGTDLWRYMPCNASTDETGVIYFASEEVAKAYSAAHPEDLATITKFEGGECFYHLWLKHTVLDKTAAPRPTFPMEYGIVRNHIYRVALSFSGIGREDTTVDDPHNVTMTIFVRPWRFFTHDTIIM